MSDIGKEMAVIEMIDEVALDQEESPAVAVNCSCRCNCSESLAEDSNGRTGDDRSSNGAGAHLASDYDING